MLFNFRAVMLNNDGSITLSTDSYVAADDEEALDIFVSVYGQNDPAGATELRPYMLGVVVWPF